MASVPGTTRKLTTDEVYALRRIARDQANPSGWAIVHSTIAHIVPNLPCALVEFQPATPGYEARVCFKAYGEIVLRAAEWLV